MSASHSSVGLYLPLLHWKITTVGEGGIDQEGFQLTEQAAAQGTHHTDCNVSCADYCFFYL